MQIHEKIWASVENVLLIYIGSAAEFPLNPENHWLFYTNELPSNPQHRFVETFAYNRQMLLMSSNQRKKMAQKIRSIHSKIEEKRSSEEGRQMRMSNDAFLMVGDMLIDYGIRGYEYLHRTQLSTLEKNEYFSYMVEYFAAMDIRIVDSSYEDFIERRTRWISSRLKQNKFTDQLYKSYRKDIGSFKLWFVKQFQAHFVPEPIVTELGLQKNILFTLLYKLYPRIRSKLFTHFLLTILVKPKTRHFLLSSEHAFEKRFGKEVFS